MPKNLKYGPFEIFQHTFCRKKNEGDPLGRIIFSEKRPTMPKKKLKGGPARYCRLSRKKGKSF